MTYAQWGDYAQFTSTATLLTTTLIEKDYNLLATQGYSYVSAIGTMTAVKNLIDTTRPNGGKHSFPSGHTTSAFLGVYPLYKKYGYKVGIPAFLIAASVAHSRVEGNYHYSRDVIAGALLALGSDYFFFKDKIKSNISFSLAPKSIFLTYRY